MMNVMNVMNVMNCKKANSLAGFKALWGVILLFMSLCAHAHLLEAQRGTLTVANEVAHVVLSLPVSAFKDVDDDGDGLLSTPEVDRHRKAIEARVQTAVQLSNTEAVLPLTGLLVQRSLQHDATLPSKQLLVLGNFQLGGDHSALRFKLNLFGNLDDEKRQHITVTRGSETQLLTLTPEATEREILPSAWRVFMGQLEEGVTHILAGNDHLLFLFVVLAAETRFLAIVYMLTAFTLGHSVTLVASSWLGWMAPAALVEPAIAVTIVGLAWLDLRRLRRQLEPPLMGRMSLVFFCATIHGLALANAFTDLGLQGSGKILSVAGFNLGIEVAQLSIALLVVFALKLTDKLLGISVLTWGRNYFLVFAMGLGVFWFVQRVALVA